VLALLAAIAVASWTHPLAFDALPGWQTGASGDTRSQYAGAAHLPGVESTAWIARRVRYRDTPTADPPSRTLERLPPDGVVVWAVIFAPLGPGQAPIRLDLSAARRLACCDGTYVPGGLYELAGAGPHRAYSAIVRVYFGSRPTPALRAAAQRALDRLLLPPAR
jgi:hypothetical protein